MGMIHPLWAVICSWNNVTAITHMVNENKKFEVSRVGKPYVCIAELLQCPHCVVRANEHKKTSYLSIYVFRFSCGWVYEISVNSQWYNQIYGLYTSSYATHYSHSLSFALYNIIQFISIKRIDFVKYIRMIVYGCFSYI